jgi:Na+-driven multidrug efflux pump
MIFWPASFTLPNSLRAAGDAKYTMIVSLLSVWIVRIGMSYVFGIGLGFGALGVWMAMICDWIVRVAFFSGRFARGKWKTFKLV